jgi:putative phage-type endonuclease
MMKVITLEQNTPEWLTYRRHHIGGSDAPSVQGIGFMTPNQLFMNKLGLWEPFVTARMNRGHELEGAARSLAMEMLQCKFSPLCIEHDKRPWQSASLDGIDPQHTFILEIKTGGAAALERAKKGVIPDYHYCQIQHQLEVSGLDRCVYFFYDGENGYPIDVKRDTRYINQLNEAEESFWERLLKFEAPPLLEKEIEPHETAERIRLGKEWREAKDQSDYWDRKEKEAREKLIIDAGERNTVGGGVKIVVTGRAGSIDYKAIPELRGRNLEEFRKDAVKFYRVSKT